MKRKDKIYAFGITVFFLFLLFSGCSKKTDDPNPSTFNGKKYSIPAGTHESTQQVVFKTTHELRFKAKFDSSAIYTTIDPLNQDDTNKLYGLSDCGSLNHQINSARFGWRWMNNQLEIMTYCYIDGVRPEPIRITTVALNTVNTYSITFNSDRYIFTVNDTSKVEVPKNCNYNSIRYKLYPYFGGDETAPQEINIWIEEL